MPFHRGAIDKAGERIKLATAQTCSRRRKTLAPLAWWLQVDRLFAFEFGPKMRVYQNEFEL